MNNEKVQTRLTIDYFQIGINPGLYAAFKGHHYAGPGNHFCKCSGAKYRLPHVTSMKRIHL